MNSKIMKNEKPILAIETSESLCGASVYFNEKKYFEVKINLKNAHAEKLFEGIDFVLKNAKVEAGNLEAVAVSMGPGSFTGLRIGMSAAKGLAFGSGLPVIPVPTFEALALQISQTMPEGACFIIANKVNMEEIYYAKFQIKSNNYIFADDLTILNHQNFVDKAAGCPVFGNVALTNLLGDENRKVYLAAPDAGFVARWAKNYGSNLVTFNYDYLEPNYLKNFIIKGRKNV